ncbi:MAG: MafI family immunity protein [Microcystis sp. M_OC_Ca_00000000_S217Cul]|nr:MAG: MafI family immunity protein [Microcystis sp. M_OC_Ca_00000000_S217Cul]TRT91098.1 MAG: MafI family immunity protein [Microcystis sp. M_OC_Ca_00000000_C217Col]
MTQGNPIIPLKLPENSIMQNRRVKTSDKLIKSKLNEVILLTKEVMLETQIEFIRSYIDAGEWRLAVETLCDILYEDELPLSATAYSLIQEISSSLDIKNSVWEILKPQVLITAPLPTR